MILLLVSCNNKEGQPVGLCLLMHAWLSVTLDELDSIVCRSTEKRLVLNGAQSCQYQMN